MQKINSVRWILIIITLLAMPSMKTGAQNTTNEQQARNIFNKTYQLVFGPQGSSLHYDVNIIGLYKTSGDICYKGKKLRYGEDRYASWNDGVTAYMVDKKKKTVDIYKADSDEKDKYLSKFKFDLNDFEYNWSSAKDGILLSMKLKNAKFFGIREVQGLIDRKTYYPISLRIKVAFFWTTVKISDFKSGNVSDQVFVFPSNQFKGYRVTDKRND